MLFWENTGWICPSKIKTFKLASYLPIKKLIQRFVSMIMLRELLLGMKFFPHDFNFCSNIFH